MDFRMTHGRVASSRAAAMLAAVTVLAGCMGIDVQSVRRAGLDTPVPAGEAVAVGRVRWIVDGEPLDYHLLNKPAMLLYRPSEGRYLNTPETAADGRFVWRLPPGEYTVAVLFGGMAPAGQLHVMTTGHSVFVNGIVDPGLAFTLEAGQTHWLGAIVIEARSKPADALLGGRVFGSLEGLRVADESAADGPRRPSPRPLRQALFVRLPH